MRVQNRVEPVIVSLYSGVHAIIVGEGAAVAPAGIAGQVPLLVAVVLTNERASGITLARVYSTLGEPWELGHARTI